jgi:tetratricopeptide (TPR) repeat protein
VLLGLLVLSGSIAGTLLGADAARRAVPVREQAEDLLQTALARGSDDAGVRQELTEMRRTLGWRPLETRTRVAYASLVLGLGTRREDLALAAFHAGRAADLAPVTVPVVRGAALVLAQAGERDRALSLVRQMFDYDPGRAALTLSQIESFTVGLHPQDVLPDRPEAWMAWWGLLRSDARWAEAEAWLAEAHRRWPDYLPILIQVAARAFNQRDWTGLATLLPAEGLPAVADAAPLYLWRAHLRLQGGDVPGARADAERALDLAPRSPSLPLAAGELFEALGDTSRARELWTGALHRAAAGTAARRPLLERLARLEDRHGSPAAALRRWREILAVDPGHAEALRRVDDLSGFQR